MTELQEALAAVEEPPRWHDVDAGGLPHAEAGGRAGRHRAPRTPRS